MAGVLEGDLFDEPTGGAERFEGVLSVVVQDPSDGIKPLPKLYLGSQGIFADRSLEKVARRLELMGRTIVQAAQRPTYLLQPIRYGELPGLYANDFFNRSKFRFELRREGFSFASDPYVRLPGNGTVECDGWGQFVPRFVIYNPGSNTVASPLARGRLVFILSTFRLGSLTPWDVTQLQLVTTSSIGAPAVAAGVVREQVEGAYA